MAAKKGLGKGLDSLITDKVSKPVKPKSNHAADAVMIDINKVEPNREQPRKKFDEDALIELSESIKQFGILQPLLCQERDDYYEIVAGERRWRAAKLAGLKEVPVIIKKLTNQQIMEISLIENIQREDLNPIEEALAYKRLLEEFKLKQDEVARLLQILTQAKYNIFISGGTGSGKTTFLNALSQYIPDDERIITIEDSAELQLLGAKNIVRLETRNANTDGVTPITIRDLIRTALRMRPDRIIVGECRGAEALDMLQAMNTGHDGSLSTGHANSPHDIISRIETMVLQGQDFPLNAIRQQIASGIDIIVQLGRLRDKSRRVLEISEVDGFMDGEIVLHTLYRFEETAVLDSGRIQGFLKKAGTLCHTDKLMAAGLSV